MRKRDLVLIIFGVIIIAFLLFNAKEVKRVVNNWRHGIQKVDDVTNYETIKKVEDTCRAMISSYEADKLTYEQYIKSDDKDKQSWAEQAKIRANKTASSYNNYILKNSYIWKNNIPKDIAVELKIIK